MEKLSQQAPELQDLLEKSSDLLTDGLCEKHEPVKTLRKQCKQLEPKWEELQDRIDRSLNQLENRVSLSVGGITGYGSGAIDSIISTTL